METKPSHIWFCKKCKRKGDMEGNDTIEMIHARQEHKTSSPNCGELIRISTSAEVEEDPEIHDYQDWSE